MAIVIAFLGVGMVAIPTGIISAGFVEYYTKIKVGSYSQHNADFITINIANEHPYIGLRLKDMELPRGLYPAVVLRGDDVYTPHESLVLEEGDSLLLGTTSTEIFECRIDEMCLEADHSWIGHRIKDLDISRRVFVVMVKRGNENICPRGSTLLLEGDVVLLLERQVKNA